MVINCREIGVVGHNKGSSDRGGIGRNQEAREGGGLWGREGWKMEDRGIEIETGLDGTRGRGTYIWPQTPIGS